MALTEAIKTALQYETKVHGVYLDAEKRATDKAAKRVFAMLAEEERGHIAYLNNRLEEWEKTGAFTVAELTTVVPPKEQIEKGVAELKAKVEPRKQGQSPELEMLLQALEVEAETGAFYERMVRELEGDQQKLFEQFMKIEEGHKAIVQAQIDCVTGLGFWFDQKEFTLEGA